MRTLLARLAATVSVVVVVLALLPGGLASADLVDPTLTVTAPSGTPVFGTSIAFTGRLALAGTGLAAATVELQQRSPDGSWAVADTAVTDADGQVGFARTAAAAASWRLHYAGDGSTTSDATSSTVEVPVRVALSAAWRADGVRVRHRATVRGVLGPGHGSVRLQRQTARGWHTVAVLPVAVDGRFHGTVTPTTAGFSRYRVVRPADPGHVGATVTLARLDAYRLHTYVVRTRGQVRAQVARFAAFAAATYADPRGWRRGHHRFRRVATGGDFTLVLAQARYLPTYSRVCSATYSCRVGRYVVINDTRWRRSSRYFTGDLATYRTMLVNHETGHWLGRPHAYCSAPGRLAPVMQQQSKGMHGCRPNGWPLAREIRAVT